MNFRVFLALTLLSLGFYCSTAQADDSDLPALGDISSSIVSLQQEYITGQQWLRAFRRQAPVSYDPLIYIYLHDLIQNLALYSQLQEHYFSLIVVDSPSFNAFAVPGNVIGINTGLLSYAESEDQLASVIAHELGHLSQRHFARGQEIRRKQSMATLAALLGSLLILATVGSEEGMAALTATQAAAIGSQLKYSRSHEQEADRIGIQTLANAGMNPQAAANMFQHLLISTRYNDRIQQFDFMLTHPLTDSRVSDAFSQARQYPLQVDKDSLDFHLTKARINFLAISNSKNAVDYFSALSTNNRYPTAQAYGLALAYIAQKKITQAQPLVDELLASNPYKTAFVLLQIDLLLAQDKAIEAQTLAQKYLSLSPNSYPLSMKIAEISLISRQAKVGIQALQSLQQSKNAPETPDIWYLLAELQGLEGNIAEVHLSRAEYFQRVGAYTQAQRHLSLALPLIANNPQAVAKAKIEINRLEKIKNNQQF